ncbi:MAG: response regulator [Chloroflexi bacterium]|nr:response regulator [Chloroflexota bacterium]
MDDMEGIILVVDDDPLYGKLLASLLLRNTPHQVWVVQTGNQALKAAQEITPILLLLDYQLPDMTGIKLYDLLHEIAGQESVPAIMLSADLPNQELEELLLARKMIGMNKLFDPKHLLQAIDRAIVY